MIVTLSSGSVSEIGWLMILKRFIECKIGSVTILRLCLCFIILRERFLKVRIIGWEKAKMFLGSAFRLIGEAWFCDNSTFVRYLWESIGLHCLISFKHFVDCVTMYYIKACLLVTESGKCNEWAPSC